jgi:hypothetical protein
MLVISYCENCSRPIGASKRIYGYADGLVARGHRVTLVHPQESLILWQRLKSDPDLVPLGSATKQSDCAKVREANKLREDPHPWYLSRPEVQNLGVPKLAEEWLRSPYDVTIATNQRIVSLTCPPKTDPATMSVQPPERGRGRTLDEEKTQPGADRLQATPGGRKARLRYLGPGGRQGAWYKRDYQLPLEKPLRWDEYQRDKAPQGGRKENARLKKLVADQALDIDILK